MASSPSAMVNSSSADSAGSSAAKLPAAARVFAIPELLEDILLLAATNSVHHYRFGRNSLFAPPGPGRDALLSLITIQRVSKAFLNTIEGSVKLKQLICRAPRDNHQEYPSCPAWVVPKVNTDHEPLLWFLERVIKKSIDEGDDCFWPNGTLRESESDANIVMRSDLLWFTYHDHKRVHRHSFHGRPESALVSAFPFGWQRAEASWRSIKICTSKDIKPFAFSISTDESWDTVTPCIGRPSGQWTLDGNTTLGAVYELILGFMRLVDEQRVVKAEMDERFEQTFADERNKAFKEQADRGEMFGIQFMGERYEDEGEDLDGNLDWD